MHPLVLLSVVDHFNRMGKIGNQKRVVGLLLGSWSTRDKLDISNSFAVPFDEDEKDREAWYVKPSLRAAVMHAIHSDLLNLTHAIFANKL